MDCSFSTRLCDSLSLVSESRWPAQAAGCVSRAPTLCGDNTKFVDAFEMTARSGCSSARGYSLSGAPPTTTSTGALPRRVVVVDGRTKWEKVPDAQALRGARCNAAVAVVQRTGAAVSCLSPDSPAVPPSDPSSTSTAASSTVAHDAEGLSTLLPSLRLHLAAECGTPPAGGNADATTELRVAPQVVLPTSGGGGEPTTLSSFGSLNSSLGSSNSSAIDGGATASYMNAQVFLFGGRLPASDEKSDDIYLNDLHVFHPAMYRWTEIARNGVSCDWPGRREGATMSFWESGNKLVLFGGEAPGSAAIKRKSLDLRPSRDLVAVAGQSSTPPQQDSSKYFNDLWVYDLSSGGWQEIDTSAVLKPGGRAFHSSVVWRNLLIVFGGYGCYEDSDVWALTLGTWTWQRWDFGGSLDSRCRPQRRFGHVAAVWNNRMYVFGGKSKLGRVDNTLWRLDLLIHEWAQLPGPSGSVAPVQSGGSGSASNANGSSATGPLSPLCASMSSSTLKRKAPGVNHNGFTTATTTGPTPAFGATSFDSPHVRALSAAVAVANRWLIFGGESLSGAGRHIASETLEFNFKLERWRIISSLPIPKPLIGAAAAAIASEVSYTILLIGGADISNLAKSTTNSIEILKSITAHARLEDIALPVPMRDILCSLRHLVLEGAPRSVVRDMKRMVSAMVKRQDASERAVAELAAVSQSARQQAEEASEGLTCTMEALAQAERREEQLEAELASIEAAKAAVAGRELALLRNIEKLKARARVAHRKDQARVERAEAALKDKDTELARVRESTKLREAELLEEAESLQRQLAAARLEAQQLSADCEEATRKAADLASELEARYAEAMACAQQAKGAAEQLLMERSEMTRQLESGCAHQERLQNEVSLRRQENDRLESLVARKETEMLEAVAASAAESRRLLEEQSEDESRRREKLQEQLSTEAKARQDIERMLSRRTAEVAKLSEQLQTTKEALEETISELTQVRKQVAATAAELDRRTHALNKAAADLEDVSGLNEDLTNQLRELGKRMAERTQLVETQRAELEMHFKSKQDLVGGMQRLVELMELQKHIVEQQSQQTLSRLREVVAEAKRGLEQSAVAARS